MACLGLVLALAASAVEIKSDWSIVYADKSVGADGCTECALRRTAGEIATDFEEAAGFEFPDWKHLENAYAEKDGNVYCFGNDRPGLEGAKPWEWHYANLPSLRATMRFMRDVVGARYLLPERTGTAVPKREKHDSSRKLDMLAYIYTADVVSTMDGCLAHAKRCKMTDRERTRLKRVEIEWAYARNLGRIATLYNGYWSASSRAAAASRSRTSRSKSLANEVIQEIKE